MLSCCYLNAEKETCLVAKSVISLCHVSPITMVECLLAHICSLSIFIQTLACEFSRTTHF